MLTEGCAQRRALYDAVAHAVGAAYKAKALYESAKEIKGQGTIELHVALAHARKAELEAIANLRSHIDAHGCQSLKTRSTNI